MRAGLLAAGAGVVTAALLAGSAALGAQGAARVPADQPVARTDENSRIAHEELLAKTKQGRIDVYFAGDSITRRWGATDYPELLAHWRQTFSGWNAANFAWGGDTTHNILWRLQNGELDGVRPKAFVLLAGTNNIPRTIPAGEEAALIADITRGVRAIVGVMQTKVPEATIVLMGLLPRNQPAGVMAVVDGVNANLAALADTRRVRYVSLNARLSGSDGRLPPSVSTDGLHLTLDGYRVWADALTPLLAELLGPRASEDHAPPPTGDPSARARGDAR